MDTLGAVNFNDFNGLGAFGQGDQATLYPNQQLTPNTSIISDNGVFTFGMGGDGNLWVKDNVRNVVLHSFNIANRGAVRAVMQGDGNFVVYDAKNGVIWQSKTAGSSGAYMVMQDDGNLVIYYNGRAIWALGTNQNPTLVTQEANVIKNRNLPPLTPPVSPSVLDQYKKGKLEGWLDQAHEQALEAYNKAVLTAFTQVIVTHSDKPLQPDNIAKLQNLATTQITYEQDGKVLTDWINDLVSNGYEWKAPELNFRATDYGFTAQSNFADQKTGAENDGKVSEIHRHTVRQSSVVYKMQLDKYVSDIKAIPNIFNTYDLKNRISLLKPLLYCFVYFQTRAINLTPFRYTGHSDRHNWGAFIGNWVFAMDTLTRIIDLASYLQLPSKMVNTLKFIKTTMGGDQDYSKTWMDYPDGNIQYETGIRRLTDDTYHSQTQAAAENADFWHQVEVLGTKFWHSVAMPAIGFTLIPLMIALTPLTMFADLFGLKWTQAMYHFIGGMFAGLPFVGKYLQMWIDKLGDYLEKIPQAIRQALAPPKLTRQQAQDVEYNKIVSLSDNELVNFAKGGNLMGIIKNDWNDDHGNYLAKKLVENINSRPQATKIWAQFSALDKLQLSGA